MTLRARGAAIARSRTIGYAAGFAIPIVLTFACTWLALPPFVFEHLVVVLVLAVAMPWGLGPAVLAAVVSVVSDNVLLREPIGRATITGYRDVLDLALFATVAIVVSGLVTRAHAARLEAQRAADRERRMREDRDRVIATVTHDLATPLSVLSGTVQSARLRGTANVDWSRLLDRLETASARATSLVRMLADARALETDRVGLELAAHDLCALVSPIVRMMDRLSERHPLVLSVPDEPVMVWADADRLKRVLENLVNNSIKYSPDGGAVEVTVERSDREAILRVRDYGMGIAPEALPRIFEPSFRAPGAATHAPGLGLGLSIARQFVALHGGTISARAAEGRGTVVTVGLPLAPVDREEAKQRVSAPIGDV